MSKIHKLMEILRGRMEPQRYKDYILFLTFYQHLSVKEENILKNMNKGTAVSIRERIIEELGYFIHPQYLFSKWSKVSDWKKLNAEYVMDAWTSLLENVKGLDAQYFFDDLFVLPEIDDLYLGEIVKAIQESETENEEDVLGNDYMEILSLFSGSNGKVDGEFYTPHGICSLVTEIVRFHYDSIESISDPACGSGSLLFDIKESLPVKFIHGRDTNTFACRLSKMNAVLHGCSVKDICIENGDTLYYEEDREFQVIVANPPFSLSWKPYECGKYPILAPRARADYAFVLHIVSCMKEFAVIILPVGVLYREGQEQKIRKWLIEHNLIDTVITLSGYLFPNATVPVCLLILNKCKISKEILFIDGSRLYSKVRSERILEEEHIEKIMKLYKNRNSVDKFSILKSPEELHEYSLNINLNPVENTPTYEETDLKSRMVSFQKEIDLLTKQIIKEVFD